MERNQKQKLIAVSARAPYPLNSGGKIASFNTLKSLSKKYYIKLYIITDNVEDLNSYSYLKKEFGEVVIWKKSKLFCYLDSLRFLILGRPMQLGYFYSNQFKKVIENNNNLELDYFIGFVLRTAIYGKSFKAKKFIYSIDSMYLNYKNSVKNTKNLFWKIIYKLESILLKKYELTVVKSFDRISYVNPNEAEFWSRHGEVRCIPHGLNKINNHNIRNNQDFKNSVVFIGKMDYRPNIIAVQWFINNVFNFLPKEVEFLIIGGHASKDLITRYSGERIKFLGFIEDPDTIIKNSLCSIAPMLTGGGLQTKIIKSFSLGSIVIMSELASKPILNFVNGKHGFIANEPQQYIHLINDILKYRSNYSRVKGESIRLFLNNYENAQIENQILKYFN